MHVPASQADRVRRPFLLWNNVLSVLDPLASVTPLLVSYPVPAAYYFYVLSSLAAVLAPVRQILYSLTYYP